MTATGMEQLVNKLRNPGPSVKVALVGKYVQLNDACLSVVEALQHACVPGRLPRPAPGLRRTD